jgi:hypothetical protein
MKYPAKGIACRFRICWLVLVVVCILAESVLALRMTKVPDDIQTKIKDSRARTISLKLPLLQPAFHWTFLSREDFLSGKLLLRIIRDTQVSEIVIFEKGKFTNGWEAMPLPPASGKEEIYFGFISTRKYLTAPGDKLELELTVNKDLPGIGATETGILPAGKYTSKGSYSLLIDEYDTTLLAKELAEEGKMSPEEQQVLLNKLRAIYEHKAFLESWTDQWPLNITGEKGWLSDEQRAALKQLDANAKRPVASTDSVVVNETFFQKHLWLWDVILLVALPVLLFIRWYFAKP